MKKEDFTALGISEELAVKAEQASKKELEGYKPKADLEAITAAKEQLEKDVKARDAQLEDLKKANGDNEELKQAIADLQAENKAAKEKYDADMKDLRLSTAIKLAVGETAHDTDLVAGLFDKSKLILLDDGKVTGLTEQLKTLQKDKAFLFKEAKPAQIFRGGKPAEGNGAIPGDKTPSKMTYSEMCAYLEANPGASID